MAVPGMTVTTMEVRIETPEAQQVGHDAVVAILVRGVLDAHWCIDDWSSWMEFTAELAASVTGANESELLKVLWYAEGMNRSPEKDAAWKVLTANYE